jgi:protein Tex
MTREQQLLAETAHRTGVSERQAAAVDELLADGATVPFLARYRKERTDGLDETQIRAVRDTLTDLRAREHRREYVRAQLAAQEVLTEELTNALEGARSLAEIEDLYLPHRKRRTSRATRAQEAGLEPLAREIYAQQGDQWRRKTGEFICEAYPDREKVVEGCRDLIAAWIAEDRATRGELRELFVKHGVFETRKKETNHRFAEFFAFRRPAARVAGHRVLGALRAVAEGAVRLTVRPDEMQALAIVERHHYRRETEVRRAAKDAYRRLLLPSLETELLGTLKEQADREAIAVFAANLRQILLQPPLGQRSVLAIDPGFRTGCKLAALDASGAFLAHGVIYPLEPKLNTDDAARIVRQMITEHGTEVIAVGNGTGGRETEQFLRSLDLGVLVVLTDESGASVYSASDTAREEFPDLDLTVRGAISIGRRLQDPLAELVKIDPQSIGVGQYQHDVNESLLKHTLRETVEECVNRVGVNLNQASEPLLQLVSGLSSRSAQAIVATRTSAPFSRREELLNVPGIGKRTYQQAAGFLRIRDGAEPLDATAVHPEHYVLARALLSSAGLTPDSSMDSREALRSVDLRSVDLQSIATGEAGLATLTDIREELLRPGRDPRAAFEPPSFRDDINSIDDLTDGMILTGVVTNLTRFGAFVDLGVHQDGLVHVSEIADRFVSDPAAELRLRQEVRVKVISVDTDRSRIGLSIRQATDRKAPPS